MSHISITKGVRRLLGDQGESFQAAEQGDGTTTRFDLPVENIEMEDPAPIVSVLEVNRQKTLNPQSDYGLDSIFGVLTFTIPPTSTQTIFISGVAYREHSSEDVQWYIDTTFAQYTKGRVPMISLDDPVPETRPPTILLPAEEEYVFTLAVAIEAMWSLLGESSQDVDVTTPDGVQIPRGQYFQQVLTAIQGLEAEYERRARLLNVGLERIEMFTLRRVSRTTNKLVPIYEDREFDNRQYPQRVLPSVDTGGGQIITYRSTWDPTAVYAINDIVDWKNLRYIAVAPSTNIQPDTDVGTGQAGLHWQLSNINTGWQGFF